nr:MAG TPA: type-F conjugative transfer system pilin assembly protein [Caudoviricetes sp.]DAK58662.1 MAG TPA: type-F conjugative transfer system pilin assembly protein [Caudoviricetes sp.]
MIDEKLKTAIEKALAAGFRVQLKGMKDGSVKAQIIEAKELKK